MLRQDDEEGTVPFAVWTGDDANVVKRPPVDFAVLVVAKVDPESLIAYSGQRGDVRLSDDSAVDDGAGVGVEFDDACAAAKLLDADGLRVQGVADSHIAFLSDGSRYTALKARL